MAKTLAFTKRDLRLAAGERSYDRGLDYLDCVGDLDVTVGEVTATVAGSADYEVTLAMGRGGVTGDCSCPYGLEGNFCKHCVAVGLAVLSNATDLRSLQASAQTKAQSLENWLASLTREDLLDLVREQIAEDRDLRRRLELQAAKAARDVPAISARIVDLLDVRDYARHGYIEYAEAFDYADQVGEAVTAIDTLIDVGNARDAVSIAEEAIELLMNAYNNIDDSSGSVGDAMRDVLAAHVRACVAARPDPVGLGQYLADKLLHPAPIEFDLNAYTEVLGPTGLAKVRERVTDAWSRNPSGWTEKHLVESLIRAEGDVDALVEVMSADLDNRGYTHLRIATELERAGRHDDALTWAERGVREAAQPDPRLADYVVDRYQTAGRVTDALDTRRALFRSSRTLLAYQQLREAAKKAGAWPDVRAGALKALRADASRRPARRGAVWIDALLDDDDIAGAWQAAPGVANEPQWLRLADAVAVTQPADALTVYLRLIEPLKGLTGDPTYQQIVRLLVAARACWLRLSKMDEYAAYVAALRTDQKRKRNLMHLLDQHKL